MAIIILIPKQSNAVKGKVAFTCNAWQARNVDAYFAVMAHWIEQITPTRWKLHASLIGFMQMNYSHHGVHLGQTLFQLIMRVGIIHKVR